MQPIFRTPCNYLSSLQVVNVYEIIKRQLVHKKSLYGHSDGITCLAASSAYGLLVSGSRDRSAIIWDLARKAFVRQLIPHEAPVAALAINEQTVSCGVRKSCTGGLMDLCIFHDLRTNINSWLRLQVIDKVKVRLRGPCFCF